MVKTARRNSKAEKIFQEEDSQGFTLVEVIVVVGIIAVLFALSWGTFYGLRTTMALKQASENLKSDISYARRSAMFVKRDIGETWINGVGVDLSGMKGEGETSYTLFKWCTSGSYIDYEEGNFIEAVNNPYATVEACSGGRSEFVAMTNKKDVILSEGEIVVSLGCNGTENDSVTYIVFEAIRGVPHFYDNEGREVCTGNESDIQIFFDLLDRTNGVSVGRDGDIVLTPGAELSDSENGSKSGSGREEEELPEEPCEPICRGRNACGSDGCGGSCGSCGSLGTCNKSTGQCEFSIFRRGGDDPVYEK